MKLQKKTALIILVMFTLGIFTLAYFLFFHLKVNPYFGMAITFVMTISFLFISKKEVIVKNYREILRGVSIILGLSVIYANLFMCTSILHLDVIFLCILSAVASILTGFLSLNLLRGLIYVCLSAFLGVVIAVFLILSPHLCVGEYLLFEYALLPTINSVTLPFIVAISVSLFGVITGSLIGETTE